MNRGQCGCRGLTLALIGCLTAWHTALAAEVAFLFSTYQEQQFAYMPGEYQGQYSAAGALLTDAGFAWDRLDSPALESGALRRQGCRVLLISYTGVMSRAEAAAIADFVQAGGKVFAVYSSCAAEWKDGKAGDAGPGLLADVLGMEYAGTEAGARYLKTTEATHPLLRRLPLCLFNPHGYAVRMRPRAGTRVLAQWTGQDFSGPAFAEQDSGALLVSPGGVCFSGFLWRLPEARIVISNVLNFLLGRAVAADEVTWGRSPQAAPVKGGLNLQPATTTTEDIDGVGLPLGTPWHGMSRPTCAVVYPVGAPDSYYVAKRLARALRCPLVPDRAALRDRLDTVYDLIAVGRLFPDRCENPLGNLQRGIGALLADYAGAASLAVVRQAPADAAGQRRRLLLVGGTDLAGLLRAEEALRRGIDPEPLPDSAGLLIWQAGSGFGDLVYPWSLAGAPITALTLPAAVNQQARTQFVLTASRDERPVELDLRLAALSGPAGTIPPGQTQLLATRYLTSNVTKIDEPDPLTPATHLALTPGGHQQIWLRVDCTDLPPGTYTGALSMLDPAGAERGRLAVSVEVAPIVLAPRNRHDLLTTVWDYALSGHLHGNLLNSAPGGTTEAREASRRRWGNHYEQHFRQYWRAYVDDLEAHGINVMFIATTACMPQYQPDGRQLDDGLLDALVPYARQHGFRCFIFTQILGQGCYTPDSDQLPGGGAPLSPAWDEAYRVLLRAYVEFARRQGLGFGEWAVYPFDEPHCDHDRQIINHVAGLRDQVDPRIQLWADPMASQEKGLTTLDFWRSMEKSIDIWWPGDGYIATGSESLAYLRRLGKPFGFYECAAYNTKNRPVVQPDRYYRSFGFRVVERGAAGMGFWTWCAWLGDSWDDEDDATRDGDGAVIYEGPQGPVTSLGWEAWGEGIDDYKYVAALRAAIAALETSAGKADARCAAARHLLDEAVASSVKDIRQADAQRLRLRAAILELGK